MLDNNNYVKSILECYNVKDSEFSYDASSHQFLMDLYDRLIDRDLSHYDIEREDNIVKCVFGGCTTYVATCASPACGCVHVEKEEILCIPFCWMKASY